MVVDKVVLCSMLINTVSESPPPLLSKVINTRGCSTKIVKKRRFCYLTTGKDRQKQKHLNITSRMHTFVVLFSVQEKSIFPNYLATIETQPLCHVFCTVGLTSVMSSVVA